MNTRCIFPIGTLISPTNKMGTYLPLPDGHKLSGYVTHRFAAIFFYKVEAPHINPLWVFVYPLGLLMEPCV
jgi:hypothetical protein